MTDDQVLGIVRTVLAAVAGYLTGHGLLDANLAAVILGPLTALVVAGWSYWSNRPAKIVETATAQPKDIVGAIKAAEAATVPSQ